MSLSDFFWFVVFGLAAVVALLWSRAFYRESISPVSVYVGVNCVSVCGYHLRLLPFVSVSAVVHMILLISMMAFSVGSLGASAILKSRRTEHFAERAVQSPAVGVNRFFYLTAAFSTIGWVTQLGIVIRAYGLSYVLSNLWILQNVFSMQFIGYLNMIGILVLPSFILKTRHVGRHFRDYVLVLSAITGLLLAGIKQYIVFSLVAAVFCYSSLHPGRVGLRHVLGVAIAVVFFFVAYDNVIDVFVAGRTIEGSSFSSWLSSLERPYLYLAGSWPAMDHIVFSDPAEPIAAYVVLQPLWKVLGDGLGIIDPVPKYLPAVSIGSMFFNVYSFVGEVHWDFGLLGVIAFSCLLGYISTLLYLRARSSAFWAWRLLYGVWMYGVTISFFSYYYRFGMLFLLGYVWLLSFLPSIVKRRLVTHVSPFVK